METVIIGVLERCRLCAGLNDAALANLAKRCALKTYAAGALLCVEGEPGRELFILDSGVLEIFTELADGTKVVLSRLDERGQYVGEQAACWSVLSSARNKFGVSRRRVLCSGKRRPRPWGRNRS